MIAFGCSVISPDDFNLYAKPGLEHAREPDSQLLIHAAANSVARGLNLQLDQAARLEGLEALVVVHQDAEIVDPEICAKVRRALADPAVAVVGCVGATGSRNIAWWEGTVTWTSAAYAYGELGGGRLLWPRERSHTLRGPGEVDIVYGVLLVFSPWVVHNLRFDESLGLLHGYEFDICTQVRRSGRKVVAADIKVDHHHSLDLTSPAETEMWVEAHMRAAELWDTEGPAPGEDEQAYWRARARRAEADAAAARLLAASKLLQADATAHYHRDLLGEKVYSRSWQVTEPLRRASALARTLRSRAPRQHRLTAAASELA